LHLAAECSCHQFENCELAELLLHKHKFPANQINDCKLRLYVCIPIHSNILMYST
jgi:hypothetical protein